MSATNSQNQIWRCATCSFDNHVQLVRCEICHYSREQQHGVQETRAGRTVWQPPRCVALLGVCLRRLFTSIVYSCVAFVVLGALHYRPQDVTQVSLLVCVASFCRMCMIPQRRDRGRQVWMDDFLVNHDAHQRWMSRASGTRATVEMVQRLPTHEVSLSDIQTASPEDRRCAICIEDFQAGERQRTLPCFHRFHIACIDEWLQRSNLCPICKLGVDTDPRIGSLV
eukprot:TRINITY_DN68323_c0_g1_i1.p1 TRINITY_DN68323_c0_g1~~TRINITY_DN68323_c0_g1_i1.p1  ORF type:complete len:238 (+),score=5.89 TRINITY_DN68323_c0_g1_i1:42-716(+)